MAVKVTILYDNRCGNHTLQEGWGFSAFVEYENAKILFDTGGDPKAVFSNADKLSIPFDEISHLLFSHRHWDHVAGFNDVIERVNPATKLYVPRTFSWSLLKKGSSRLNKTKVVHAFEAIAPNIYSMVLRGGFWLYEQTLVLKTPDGLGIITRCAHPGIIQILKAAQKYLQEEISFVLGGFHQLFTPAEQTNSIVKQFQMMNVQKVAPCHCSGDHLIRQFQETYDSNFFKVGTGTIINF